MQDGFERRVEQTPEGEVARVFLWAGGTAYELDALDPEVDFKLARERLRLRMLDPCSAVVSELERLPPAVRAKAEEKLWDRAFAKIQLAPKDRTITAQEIIDWLDNSEDGADFSLLLLAYKRNPEFANLMAAGKVEEAVKRAADLRKNVNRAEFLKWRDEVNKKMLDSIKRDQQAAD